MWPDEPYAEGRGSFLRPVAPWTVEPDATPSKTITVACQYLPYIRGALMQLLLQSTWATNDPALLLITQGRAFNLIDLFTECDAADLPFACPYDFTTGVDDHGWVNIDYTPYVPNLLGALIAGGWTATSSYDTPDNVYLGGIAIRKDFSPAVMLDRVAVELLYNHGTFSPAYYGFDLEVWNGGSLVHQTILTDSATPTGASIQEAVFSSSMVTHLILQVFTHKNAGGIEDGGASIPNVTLFGTGDSPCDAE